MRDADDLQPVGELVDVAGHRGVTGAVVDQHHLEIRRVERLLDERRQAGSKELRAIVRRDQDRDARRRVRFGPPYHDDLAVGIAHPKPADISGKSQVHRG